MNDFAIVCDSTANLKMDYVREKGLTVIPYSSADKIIGANSEDGVANEIESWL